MKCRICGTTLPDGAKFCPGCGAEVAADTQPKSKMDSNTVEDAYYREIDDAKKAQKRNKKTEDKPKKEKKEQQNKKKTGMSIIVYLIIILVGGFALYRTGIVDNIVSSMNKTSVEKGDSKASFGDTEATAETSKKNTEHTEEQENTKQALTNTDNSNMDVEACLNTSAYNIETAKDGSFSFGYPKYLFNDSKVSKDGTSYTLSYKGKDGSKEAELIVRTESNEGDALQNAKNLYSQYASSVYKVYFKMQPTRIDSKGMARALIGGSVDDAESKGIYIIAVNDGEKNYILEFTYPDPDIHYDYNAIDYVVDCVYRYCSFSGGTYQPRTYEQFKADDMGTKK